MVGQSRLVRTILSSSVVASSVPASSILLRGSGLAVAIALLTSATPAFSQVSALDRLLEEAKSTYVSEQTAVKNQTIEEDQTVEEEQLAIDSQTEDSQTDIDREVDQIAVEGQVSVEDQIAVENQIESEQTIFEPEAEVVIDSAVSAVESEAAMQTLTEALAADGVTYLLISAETQAADSAVKQPGAEALNGLERVGIERLAVASAGRNLPTTNAAFTVDTAAVPALTAALESDQALTQLYAADAIWTLTGDSNLVLPTLMEAAASDDTDIQELAVSALRQMGNEASPAVPVLIELLDKDSRTRLIAQDAIAVIRSENRSEAVLGIISRESRRRLLPAAIRAISNLWR